MRRKPKPPDTFPVAPATAPDEPANHLLLPESRGLGTFRTPVVTLTEREG